MPQFQYVAKDAAGKTVKKKIKAPSKTLAMSELKKKALSVVSIKEVEAKKGGLFGPPKPKVKTADISVLTRQLATMISAGIPLLESLEILEEQAEDVGFKAVLAEVIEKVRGGSDFSDALAEHPKLFTRIYVNMIRAGEAGGALDTILDRLSGYMEAAEALKREIKSAMTYPVISLCLILLIVGGLMVGVVPKFKDIFINLGGEEFLPAPTRILLKTSDFMQNNVLLMIGMVVAFVIALMMFKKTKPGRYTIDWLMLNMPVFGPLFRKVAVSRFARTFATLIQSGVPILGALDIVAATSGNVYLEDAIKHAQDEVRKGETLGEPLAECDVFPPMVTKMISIGERSGALEQLLEKISEFYDQEVEANVAALTSLIEPLLIGIMGVVVGGIVLAIFLPIMKIQEMIRKQ